MPRLHFSASKYIRETSGLSHAPVAWPNAESNTRPAPRPGAKPCCAAQYRVEPPESFATVMLAWRVFDAAGRPTEGSGRASGVPVWSFGAAIARRDGGFTVLY